MKEIQKVSILVHQIFYSSFGNCKCVISQYILPAFQYTLPSGQDMRIKGFLPFLKPVIHHLLFLIIIIPLTSQCLLPGSNTDKKQKEPSTI
jgi:hypothetical protein